MMNQMLKKPRFLKPDEGEKLRILPIIDDLRSEAENTTIVYNRNHHLDVAKQRELLPIAARRQHLLYLLENHQTVIVVGETGCGKSTQIPQYLLEAGYIPDGSSVLITVPRVAAAVTLAERVALERDTICGEDLVGFDVSFHNACRKTTKIKYATEGILLREIFADPLLTQYTCIILDEVHERSQLTDILMGLVKKILQKRKQLQLIVSSATMDAEILRNFFNLNKKSGSISTATILSVEGKMYPVEIFYIKDSVADYLKGTVETIMKIHENEPFGDVLAFLAGQDEVLSTVRMLEDYAQNYNKLPSSKHTLQSKMNYELKVLPMYGALPRYKQLKALQSVSQGCRKVIVATNIAETSITIPGIAYVVDCGFHKVRYLKASGSFEQLVLCPISKANAIQRAGRAGRVVNGKCYRLYTEKTYERLPKNVPPEIQRSDLSGIALQIKALGIDNIMRFPFPSPPSAKSMVSAIEVLYALGALDVSGALTQPLGSCMAEMPLPPASAKLLCCSGDFDCTDEILSIVAMLQVESIFEKPAGGQYAIKAKIYKRNNFEVAEGDLIMLLNVYKAYKIHLDIANESGNSKHIRDWCSKMFLNADALKRVTEIRTSLQNLFTRKFQVVEKRMLDRSKTEKILQCLCTGLFMHAAFLHPSGCYRSLTNQNVDLLISPDSCLYNIQQPQWVIFYNIESSSNCLYMKNISVIRKEWLTELAANFFKEF